MGGHEAGANEGRRDPVPAALLSSMGAMGGGVPARALGRGGAVGGEACLTRGLRRVGTRPRGSFVIYLLPAGGSLCLVLGQPFTNTDT